MSIPPQCSRVFATRFSSCALSEMRAATAIASPPLARIAAATSSHGSWLRDEITTLAPESAKASAIALPMPREDPVTIATFPVRSNRFIIYLLYERRSAERPLENLVHVTVAERLQRLRPLPCHAAACGGGPHASVPANLLHVVIELDTVPVRVAYEGGVINAGIEFRRQVNECAALRLQERDRFAQLRVIGQLDAERQACRMRAKAKNAAQFPRVQRETVVLGAGTQKDAARAAINAFLAFRQSEMARVEHLSAIDIFDKEPHRADLGDLERPGQQH